MSSCSVNKPDAAFSSSFDQWLAEGLVHFTQLKHAVALAPSTTLSASISARFATLSRLATQHLALLNICTSPLLRLPREIHQHIFSDVAEGEHVQEWIGLGQTCSALRKSMLDHRCLWADAIYSWSDGRHRDEILERAGPSTPLRLSVPARNGAPDTAISVMEHLHRARVIDAFHTSFIQSFVLNVDSPSLPHLEKVNLDVLGIEPVMALEQPARQTPRLKVVQMSDVYWNFSSPALTTLVINNRTSAHAFSQLFEVLQQTKCMRSLHLSLCLPFLPDDLAPASTLSFAHMEDIYVADRRDRVLQLWRLLSVPTDAEVLVNLICEQDEQALHPMYTGPPRFQDMALFKRHFENKPALRLDVDNSEEEELEFRIFAKPDGLERSTLNATYSSFADDDQTLSADLRALERDALRRVCEGLDLSSVTHFSHAGSFGDGHWLTMLGIFRQLEHLEVQRFNSSLCSALCLKEPGPRAARRPALLPQLRQLTIGSAIVREDVNVFETLLTTKAFFNMMELRAVKGQSLHTVSLDNLLLGAGSVQEKQAFLDRLRSRFPDCHVFSS